VSSFGGILRVTEARFAPSFANDLLVNAVYMGDYDTVTSNVTGQGEGVAGAYGSNARGNPDVVFGTDN
jgi:hypothetical protein